MTNLKEKKEKFVLYTNPNNVTNYAYAAVGTYDVKDVLSSAKSYRDSYLILFQSKGTASDILKAKQLFSNYMFK